MSSLRIGFCALQVGHHDAWTAIRIGLPAFCAAAKDFASKVLASMATAGAEKLALAATAARMTERRDSMMRLLHVVAKSCRAEGRRVHVTIGRLRIKFRSLHGFEGIAPFGAPNAPTSRCRVASSAWARAGLVEPARK